MIEAHKPDIIVGTESKLDNSILSPEITPPGFTTLRKDRNTHGGGVFVRVKDHLIVTEVTMQSVVQN